MSTCQERRILQSIKSDFTELICWEPMYSINIKDINEAVSEGSVGCTDLFTTECFVTHLKLSMNYVV